VQDPTTIAVFGTLLGAASVLAFGAARVHGRRPDATLVGWSLADRRLGLLATWFVLGGSIFTAYTFVAVPGLVYGVGGLGLFALAYTVVVFPIAFVVLPRLWLVAARNGCVTVADIVRARLGSPVLALVVALTGILATMPYIALQLLGIRALLTAMGIPPDGLIGDGVLTLTFGVLALATYRSGLRAPALVAVLKGIVVFAAAALLFVAAWAAVGGPQAAFTAAGPALEARTQGAGSLLLGPGLGSAYWTLALGSALALLVYPHVTTCVFAARDEDTLRRGCVVLPAWTFLLGALATLGVAAIAAGIAVPPGRGELALPLLAVEVLPPWLTGFVLGSLAIGALVPAAIMSVAVASLFTRNLYVEYLHPEATSEYEMHVARRVSAVVKLGALAFVFGLQTEDAINLQLLGGVWIVQTFPAVALALFTRRLHRWGLLAGWAVGMVAGTALVATNDFVTVVSLDPLGVDVQAYAALLALGLNLAVATLLTPLLDRAGFSRGLDSTGTEELARGAAPRREWLTAESA
jgi:SSS family solute:Na+ symporter